MLTDRAKIAFKGVIPAASYDEVSFVIAEGTSDPMGMFFKPDGTKMYVVCYTGSEPNVFQYTLSTAWDLSTAAYDSVSFSVSEDNGLHGIFFKSDGTKMYVVGESNNRVHQYSLSTAWDLSTATYDSTFKSVTTEDESMRDLFFSSDGLKLYLVGDVSNTIYQYSNSVAWEIDATGTTYDSVSLSVAAQDTVPEGIFFNSTGTKLYVMGSSNDRVYRYTLSSAWDLSTATYDSVSYDINVDGPLASGFRSVFLKSDSTKLYTLENGTATVYAHQYTILGD